MGPPLPVTPSWPNLTGLTQPFKGPPSLPSFLHLLDWGLPVHFGPHRPFVPLKQPEGPREHQRPSMLPTVPGARVRKGRKPLPGVSRGGVGTVSPFHVLFGYSLDVNGHSNIEASWDGPLVGQSLKKEPVKETQRPPACHSPSPSPQRPPVP